MTEPVAAVWAERLLGHSDFEPDLAPDAGPGARDVRIDIENGRIAKVTGGRSYKDECGGPGTLALPALANAHDHGRGVRPVAYGVADDPVELWVPGTYGLPPVDPYLVAAVAFGRMARSGVGSILQCHLSRPPDRLIEEAAAVARAARDVGVRVAFVVPLRDRHRLGYGPDDAILAHVPAEARAAVAERFQRPIPDIEDQLACVEEIARRFASPTFHVQYGPVGVEWCSDRLLERVAEESAAAGRRVHMHLLESARQRAWTDGACDGGVVAHLDRLGLLGPRLSIAHGVWLRPADIDLLADRGVAVSVNSSSNLRLRSGIAPVPELLDRGVSVALGLDALALDDDEDMLRELRLAWRLHGGTGLDPAVARSALIRAATLEGGRLMFGDDMFGAVIPGAPADLLLLDRAALIADTIDGLVDDGEIFLARASAKHVRALIVNGRTVVRDGSLTGIDLPRLERELTADLRGYEAEVRRAMPALATLRSALREYYRAELGCC